jgi:hypothetical protein
MGDSVAALGPLLASALHSGLVIDLIILLVAAEALLLWWLKRSQDLGPGLGSVWPTLVSGVLLLLVARAALTQAWWGWVALLLALAGLSHVLDLALQTRRGRRGA